ncbi:MAG: 30S ribosomal protein S19e [Methanothrix sp.]|nr:30S ribosomal protein S19e [Methanothrix sp.]
MKDLTTVYDVPPHDLIAAVAQELKAAGKVVPPAWAEFAKTGVNKEMPPTNPDWWFVRCASVLRRIYIDGPVGVSRLRSFYGGKHRKGVATGHFNKGSGSVVREALQQLEKAGYVKKIKKGRQMTPEGQAFLDDMAHKIRSKIQSSPAQSAAESVAE